MNTNNDNKFYDLTINDLIPLTLKHWRKILLIGLIIAVAFGIYKFIPLYNTANNYDLNAAKVAENEDQKRILQEAVKKIEAEVVIKEKELADSIYYNLEPSLITQGFVSFYIDTPIKDEGLGYQKNVINSYVTYFESGEIYNKIANQLNEYIKPVYLAQIIKAEADYTNELSSFNIYVLGANENQTKEIMKLLKAEVYHKKPEIANIVTEHSIKLISENTTVITDAKVKEDQQFQADSFQNIKTKLEEKKTELQNIKSESITKTDALLTGLKFCLIGFLCGIVFAVLLFSAAIIFSNKIKSKKQIINNYSVCVLGEFMQEHKNKNKLDVFISKLAGEPYDISIGELNLVIATNIVAMSKSKKILIVGTKDVTNTKTITNGIYSCDILKDYQLEFSDEPLNNSKTLANILHFDSVIIIVQKNKTALDELQNAIYIVGKYNKDLVGVILV